MGAPGNRETRLLIMGDIRLYREGLRDILGRHDGFAVVATAGDRAGGTALVLELRPDVVLVDMAMPESMASVQEIVALGVGVNIIALAVPESEQDVIDCVEAGAVGYVTREASLQDVIDAVECAARGEALCSPRMTATLLRRVAALAAERAPVRPTRLTPRELEIVDLIERGLSNKQIARALCIEVATVKNHVHNILEKLQVERRGEAAARVRAPALRARETD